MNPQEEEGFEWTTHDQPLGPAPVPVNPTWHVPAQPVSGPILPPPPPQNVTYVQPVARRGITGPQAAVLIAVIVVVLPVLCCLGMMALGVIGGAGQTSSP